jgi:hypothetical protein
MSGSQWNPPSNPSVGQTYTFNNTTWVWNGTAWVNANTGQAFLPLAGGTLTGPVTLPGPITLPSGLVIPPNYFDNSGFNVNQRGYVSGTALAAGAYGHDRWRAGTGGCTYTFTASPPSTQITITAGILQQVLETGQLPGGAYTISWTGTAQCTLPGGTGTAASPATFNIAAGLATPTFTWGTGTLGQVQLEIGSAATRWFPEPFQIGLARCQRFFSGVISLAVGGDSPAASTWYISDKMPVQFRATPTISILSSNNTNVNSQTLAPAGLTGMYATIGVAAGAFLLNITYSGSADF